MTSTSEMVLHTKSTGREDENITLERQYVVHLIIFTERETRREKIEYHFIIFSEWGRESDQ